MARLFKYLRRAHLDAFFSAGTLRVGTLYEYRRTEVHGSEVGDRNEGSFDLMMRFPNGGQVDLASNTPAARLLRESILGPGKTSDVTIQMERKSGFIVKQHCSDMFLYCMTSKFKERTMRDFNADTCLEILNPDAFFSAVALRIGHKAKFEGLFKVEYVRKQIHYLNKPTVHPARMKDRRYHPQQEVRALWSSKESQISPFLIDVPGCREFTRVRYPVAKNSEK